MNNEEKKAEQYWIGSDTHYARKKLDEEQDGSLDENPYALSPLKDGRPGNDAIMSDDIEEVRGEYCGIDDVNHYFHCCNPAYGEETLAKHDRLTKLWRSLRVRRLSDLQVHDPDAV